MPDAPDPFANVIAEIEKLRGRLSDTEIGAMLAPLRARSAAAAAALSGPDTSARSGGEAPDQGGAEREDDAAGTLIAATQIVAHYHAAVRSSQTREQIARQVAGYLRWLCARTACIELHGIERAGGARAVRLPLANAYVPLRAKSLYGAGRASMGTGDTALNQVLGLGHRLVVIGGPGSGKTMLLTHMAWALAASLLRGEPEPARSRLGLALKPEALPLPILVPLASFARYRRSAPAPAPAGERTLAHFIACHLIDRQAEVELPPDFFVQLLKDGRDCLLLLDGLDEVANEDERAEVRQCVEDLVGGHDAMRVLVTCRTLTYRSGHTALGAGFQEFIIQPPGFDTHIVPMVRQAYACIHPQNASLREERVTDLLEGIRRLEQDRRSRLGAEAAPLVDSPLMVRLLLIVHLNDRRLPEERADLFDKAIDTLLQVDDGDNEGGLLEPALDWKSFRDMAQHLAFHMHGQGRDQGHEIAETQLRAALCEEADFLPYSDGFVQCIRQRASVLEEYGGVYRFIHPAFQEFLTARYLREVIGGAGGYPAIVAHLGAHLRDPWWHEPILLLAGSLCANAPRSGRDFLAALAQAGPTPDLRFAAAELAGTAALESHAGRDLLKAGCARQILVLLGDADALSGSRPAARARVADLLVRLGDPRFDPARCHLPADDLLGFVPIPADPDFRIGTRAAHRDRVGTIIGYRVPDSEINEDLTPTGAFCIARYPVTVAQFRVFLEVTGAQPGDPRALRDPDTRPVRYVDWWEALAYCRWLHSALTDEAALSGSEAARLVRTGQWVPSLPTELEWEIATRGGRRDLVYPWGDTPNPNAANCGDSGIGTTSAVGCFPANDFGLYDMIGNVWEWTCSRWTPGYSGSGALGPGDLETADEEQWVVRGGSWGNLRDDARCAYRYGLRAGNRHDHQGFRVVLRHHMTELLRLS